MSALHADMIDAIGALPAVDAAALIRNEPASNVPSPITTFERADAPVRAINDRSRVDLQVVSASTFDVLRMPIMAGRRFQSTDTAEGTRVAIISLDASQRFWPDRNPIGTSIQIGSDPSPVRIVGVVGAVELNWYDSGSRPTLYLSDAQAPARTSSVVIRTRVDPIVVGRDVRAAVARLDPSLAIGGLEPLARSIADSLSPIRVIDLLLATGAVVACLLAAVGVFGILAQSVSQRLREFGVRLALGATSRSIASLVLRDALATGLAGLACGLLVAGAMVRTAGSMLVGLIVVGPPVVVAWPCAR